MRIWRFTSNLPFKSQKHNVTEASQEIPHPTTGLAQPDLTDEIERDRVYCRRYERCMQGTRLAYLYTDCRMASGV